MNGAQPKAAALLQPVYINGWFVYCPHCNPGPSLEQRRRAQGATA